MISRYHQIWTEVQISATRYFEYHLDRDATNPAYSGVFYTVTAFVNDHVRAPVVALVKETVHKEALHDMSAGRNSSVYNTRASS